MESDKSNQQTVLHDGRHLGFAEYGDPGGIPAFYFHGWPGSRVEARAADRVAAEMGVRLIAIDRPGYGLSDFKPGRTIAQWPEDAGALADHLKLERFAVLGMSGGGPYAAACAAKIPGRISALILLCSMGPFDAPDATKEMVALNRWLLFFAQHFPWLARKLVGFCLHKVWRYDREVLPKQTVARLPEADKLILARPEVRQTFLANWREAFRDGVRGAVWDGCLYAQPWGFRLQEIETPAHLWHGESDVLVPLAMGRHYARVLPRCQATFCPNEGHFSLPFNHIREILGAVVG
jgi:pimeloyl-ACP methyl ester carboxylesterase